MNTEHRNKDLEHVFNLIERADESAGKWLGLRQYIERNKHKAPDTDPQRLATWARNCERTTDALLFALLNNYATLVNPASSADELRAASAAVDAKRSSLLSTLVFFERERVAWHERTSALGYPVKPTRTHPLALEVERRWAFTGGSRRRAAQRLCIDQPN